MAECFNCNPCSPDLDEDGRAYSCYCCGDTGWVPQAVADAEARDKTDRYEYRRLRPQLVTRYDNEADMAWEVKRSLLPQSVLPKIPAPVHYWPIDDDLPF